VSLFALVRGASGEISGRSRAVCYVFLAVFVAGYRRLDRPW
jgi:hypothetical protein